MRVHVRVHACWSCPCGGTATGSHIPQEQPTPHCFRGEPFLGKKFSSVPRVTFCVFLVSCLVLPHGLLLKLLLHQGTVKTAHASQHHHIRFPAFHPKKYPLTQTIQKQNKTRREKVVEICHLGQAQIQNYVSFCKFFNKVTYISSSSYGIWSGIAT